MELSYRYLLITTLIGIFSSFLPIVYRRLYQEQSTVSIDPSKSCLNDGERIFTETELRKYTKKPLVLLAFLGAVYDVTSGSYYQPGGSYEFFSGRDATRAYLTGEFTEPELRDDISDLDSSYLSGIDTWTNLYKEKYKKIGLVIGTYYDQFGCPTEKLKNVEKSLNLLKQKKDDDENEFQRYPPCNSRWDGTTKSGSVWCTNQSGGVARSWSGRPRLFYELGSKQWRCACVEDDSKIDLCYDGEHSDKRTGVHYALTSDQTNPDQAKAYQTPDCRFKYYKNCDQKSPECPIHD